MHRLKCSLEKTIHLPVKMVEQIDHMAASWWLSQSSVTRWSIYRTMGEAVSGRMVGLPKNMKGKYMSVQISLPSELEAFINDLAETYEVPLHAALAGAVAYPWLMGLGIGPGNQPAWPENLSGELTEKGEKVGEQLEQELEGDLQVGEQVVEDLQVGKQVQQVGEQVADGETWGKLLHFPQRVGGLHMF